MDAALLELAEEPRLWLGPDPNTTTVVTAGYVVSIWGDKGSVQRLRLEGRELGAVVEEVRALARERSVAEVTWWVGELSTPCDLADRLKAFGLAPDGEVPGLTSLTIDRRPGGTPTVEVRRVETYEDFVRGLEVDWEVWDVPAEIRSERRATNAAHWEVLSGDTDTRHYLALLDGTPVGFGRGVFTPAAGILLGGATLPSARGHGVYTALVHARWDDAVARGTPRLAVSAGAMSAPILARLGFRRIGTIELLVDRL